MYDRDVHNGVFLSWPNINDAIVSSSKESIQIGLTLTVHRFEHLPSLEMGQTCQYSLLWPLLVVVSGTAQEKHLASNAILLLPLSVCPSHIDLDKGVGF